MRIQLLCHTRFGDDEHWGDVLTQLPNLGMAYIKWDDGETEWHHIVSNHLNTYTLH